MLAAVLAKVVTGLRAARNMRWSDPQLAFSRPIRWLTALWGDDVVPVAVSTLAAGRHHAPAANRRASAGRGRLGGDFMETLAVNGIVADPEDRRELIVTGAQDLVYPRRPDRRAPGTPA